MKSILNKETAVSFGLTVLAVVVAVIIVVPIASKWYAKAKSQAPAA